MSDINVRCVSLATGALSPDLRVNYEFGLVLGVDEFRQEQLYFLEKGYLHDRSLHGFGTVYGLKVTTNDEGDDAVVTVEPGMGVDQWGRPVVVRTPQCARLAAWLAAEERAHPGSVAAHAGLSGEATLYVVASYAECLDALVPIPGQPCSSSEETQAASRLRDAWNLELRWAPPAMPAWDAARALATILTSVRFDGTLGPGEGDETTIVELVRNLPSAPSGAPAPPVPLRLPASTALVALDRIFTVWATEVRPRFAPELTEPQADDETGILLAAIPFVAALPFSADAPSILTVSDPDDTGRPVLLHTQLIQELLLLGPGAESAPPPLPPATAQQLVTFDTVTDAGSPIAVSAWFHLDRPLRLPPTVRVLRGPSAVPADFTSAPTGAVPFSVVWQLRPPPDQPLIDGELLAFEFDTKEVFVGDAATTLRQFIDAGGLEIVGHDRQASVVRAFFEVQASPLPATGPSMEAILEAVGTLPRFRFATVTPTVTPQGDVELEVWYHPDRRPLADEARINNGFSFEVLAEVETASTPVQILFKELSRVQHNVFRVRLDPLVGRELGSSPYLRVLFKVDEVEVVERDGDVQRLGDYMRKNRIFFDGFDGRDLILIHVKLPGKIVG